MGRATPPVIILGAFESRLVRDTILRVHIRTATRRNDTTGGQLVNTARAMRNPALTMLQVVNGLRRHTTVRVHVGRFLVIRKVMLNTVQR